MATEFRLPELGEGITEADVVRVLVGEGDTVAVDQAVATIETEKATVDVPAGIAGRVTQVHIQAGQTISPGAVVLTIEESGAAQSAPPAAPPDSVRPEPEPVLSPVEDGSRREGRAAPAVATAAEPPAPTTDAAPSPEPAAAPAAEPLAATPGPESQPVAAPGITPPAAAPAPSAPSEPAQPAPGAGRPSTDSGRTEVAAPPAAAPAFAAPSVRTFAREIGVDIQGVRGSGAGGRIDLEDVKRHARERGTAAALGAAHEAPALPDFEQFGSVEREPLSRFRRTVARNMATTWSQVPLVTLFATADTGAFEAIRRRYRDAASKAGGTLTDGVLLMKLVGAALAQFPHFNASYDEAAQELIVKRYVHIGLAVDTDRGLVVPVVRDVDKKSVVDLAVDFRGISDRVKSNSLTLEEMRGASFTISSLETLGVSHFTPLVNWPEVAILGIGRDADLPSYEREELRVHKRVALSLSFDHRVVDGADGARFLRWLVNAIHEPTMLEIEGGA